MHMNAVRAAVLTVSAVACAMATSADAKIRTYGEGRALGTPRQIAPAPHLKGVGRAPVGIGFVPGLQLPDADWDVAGLRISVFAGRNRNVYAIDIGGLGNLTEYDMGGIAVSGIFNSVGSSSGSFQAAGLFNRSHGDFDGIQIAGAMSFAEGTMTGFQAGLVNRAYRLSGVQTGAFNMSGKGCGVQIGVVNHAERLEGLQIGLINVIEASPVRFMPIVNFAF